LSDFAPHLLPIVFCSKSSLKEGKWGKRWGAKSLKKKGVQNRLKKRGCKITQLAKRYGTTVQLNTKMGCKIRKGVKREVQNRSKIKEE